MRKPFPSIRQRESQLQSGDTVNILDVSQSGNGVKFRYDYSVCSLNVRIKYSNISVTSDPRNVNHLPQFLLLPQVPAENTNDQNLIGNQFEYQHTVYQVQSIIGQQVNAFQVDNNADIITLARQHVEQLIDEYL